MLSVGGLERIAEAVLDQAGYRVGADAFEVAVALGYGLDCCRYGVGPATETRLGRRVIAYDGRLAPEVQRAQVLREVARHGLRDAGLPATDHSVLLVAGLLAARGCLSDPARPMGAPVRAGTSSRGGGQQQAC